MDLIAFANDVPQIPAGVLIELQLDQLERTQAGVREERENRPGFLGALVASNLQHADLIEGCSQPGQLDVAQHVPLGRLHRNVLYPNERKPAGKRTVGLDVAGQMPKHRQEPTDRGGGVRLGVFAGRGLGSRSQQPRQKHPGDAWGQVIDPVVAGHREEVSEEQLRVVPLGLLRSEG